jgi:transposase
MKRFVEGENRQQMILLPDCLDDYVVEDNPVRVIDVFIDELDLTALGFEGMLPATTGRPAYHPATLLKIYLYGYLNRIPSSRRLRRPWLLCTVDATGEPSGSRSHRVPTARRD